MGLRFGQLAGLAAFALMMGRLGKLFETGPDEPRWNLILFASAFLGGVAWWLLSQMTGRRWVKLTVFAAAGFLLVARITAPETLLGGVVPTPATLGVMVSDLGDAFTVIRNGVPPIAVSLWPGLMLLLAATMWTIGALFTWGSTGGPYAALFLPSIVMYLQFATFDRVQARLGWMLASGLVLALSIVSLALERRGESGRARNAQGRPMGRRSMSLAVTMALLLGAGAITVADSAAGIVDEYGNAPWRGGSGGYGAGGGTIITDRLVDLRQTLLRPSNEPVFEATLSEGAPPPNEIYWRVETLDNWDGATWKRTSTSYERYEPGEGLANEYDVYQGSTYNFSQRIRMVNLQSSVAPTAGVPVAVRAVDGAGGRSPAEFNVLSDSALVVTPGLVRNDTYEVQTLLADRSSDLGALATGADGQLTDMFQAAAEAGDFPYEPLSVSEPAAPPPDLGRYLVYPENTPASIRSRAQALTIDATSDFERAWILQSWFRDSGEFEYSLNVTTGHSALVLEDWLSDERSINYRTGYCEQFAAAMAVMARTLEIPSRVVWGYTSGTVEPQENGTEKVVVRDRNSHAWLELWIEPYGWVQFDPTPIAQDEAGFDEQPPSITAGLVPEEYLPDDPNREPVGIPDAGLGQIEDLRFAEDGSAIPVGQGLPWWLIGLAALLPLLAAVPAFKWVRRRRRLARVRDGDITAAWDEIVDRLTDLGMDIPPSLTPVELARSADRALLPLASSYASTIYGGRTGQARDSDLLGPERWIEHNYDGRARARAAMSIRSVVRRS